MHSVIGDGCFPAAPMQRFDCSRPGRVNFSRANLDDFVQNMTKCSLTKMGIKFVEHDMHEESKKGQNVYSNLYSQAVTHPSTNRSQPCLTSVIGRELVYSR